MTIRKKKKTYDPLRKFRIIRNLGLAIELAILITGGIIISCHGMKYEPSEVEPTYTQIVEKETIRIQEVPVEPKYYYNLNSTDRELLARIVYLESGISGDEVQMAVASVIMQRLNSGKWGDTLESVIYTQGQFTPANKIKGTTPTERVYQNIDRIISGGPTTPDWVLYFRSGRPHNWEDFVTYKQIENVYFGGMGP